MIINTYAPIFSGFYNTIWDISEREDLESADFPDMPAAIRDNIIEYYYQSDIYFTDYKRYQIDVCRAVVSALENPLKRLQVITNIEYQRLVSPREYNFANDSIDIAVGLSDDNIINITLYIADNYEAWREFLKARYTSYSGFMSYYDNTPEGDDWISIADACTGEHKLGAILEFILQNDGYEEECLYYDADCVHMFPDIEGLKAEYLAEFPIDDEEIKELEEKKFWSDVESNNLKLWKEKTK